MSSRSSPRIVSRKSLLDGLDLKRPIHTGHMYKQSHIPPKNFNKRFFALYPKVLVYYDSESHFGRDVHSGTLEHRQKAILIDHLYLSKPEKKPHGAKFCFILHAPNKHNERHEFLFVNDTREDRRVWMAKLQEQNPELLESEHRSRGSRGSSTSSTSSYTLEVPKPRKIRADSANPETIEEELKQFKEKVAINETEEAKSIKVEEAQSIKVEEAQSIKVEEAQSIKVEEGTSDDETFSKS